MAWYIAKNVVAAALAERCEVALAYAIGQPEPEMVTLDTLGTETVESARILDACPRVFPFTVEGMISCLELRGPIFSKTSVCGHFGRDDAGFFWGRTDTAVALRALCC